MQTVGLRLVAVCLEGNKIEGCGISIKVGGKGESFLFFCWGLKAGFWLDEGWKLWAAVLP